MGRKSRGKYKCSACGQPRLGHEGPLGENFINIANRRSMATFDHTTGATEPVGGRTVGRLATALAQIQMEDCGSAFEAWSGAGRSPGVMQHGPDHLGAGSVGSPWTRGWWSTSVLVFRETKFETML